MSNCAQLASLVFILGTLATGLLISTSDTTAETLRLDWADNILTIRGAAIPGDEVQVWYLEAFCRGGSSDRDWRRTVIPHRTHLVQRDRDGRRLRLESRLEDGVLVSHDIRAAKDEILFRLVAHNPTQRASEAHWAQPCIRVDRFTGRTQETYLPKCFVLFGDQLSRLPIEPWAKEARYTPGQVWPAPRRRAARRQPAPDQRC